MAITAAQINEVMIRELERSTDPWTREVAKHIRLAAERRAAEPCQLTFDAFGRPEMPLLVQALRKRLELAHFPKWFVVSREELEATEAYLLDWLESLGYPRVLMAGELGPYFKTVQLVLEPPAP